jgi:hypothetical protein
MRLANARSYTRQTLAGVLGHKFKRGRKYGARCYRQSAARFRCDVSWSYGPNTYSGHVSVYYTRGTGRSVEWADRYAIRSVNNACHFNSQRPPRCAPHVARGSY